MRAGPTHSPDYPWLMAAIAAVCAAGAGSAIWPAVEHTLTVAVIALPLAAVAEWALRREARIRRRLADTTGHTAGAPVPTTSTSTRTTSTSTRTSRNRFEHTGGVA